MSIAIGIIGGSGLYDMAELTDREERRLETPFGEPSAPYVIGTLRGKRVAFLARHGLGHRLMPSELNFRANIFGFKTLGVEYILSASAVGSLKEQYKPLDLVIPDQFVDRTRGRISTFFGRGLVAHVGFAHPFCSRAERHRLRGGRVGVGHRPQGRHLRVHGRTAVLDARRIAALSLVGHGHHRHDQPAGSEAGEGSGDLLHHHRAGHRLRLLAPRPRPGDGGDDHRQPDAECAHGAAGHRQRRRRAALRADLRVRQRAEIRDHHQAGRHSGGRHARRSRRWSASI